MQVVRGWQDVPRPARGSVLAIGNFDGVHRGHQAVLRRAIDLAHQARTSSGAVIFEPHPREFFAPDRPFFRLTPLPLKLHLLECLGVDRTFVIPFDAALASLSAEAFVAEVLLKGLGARELSVGHDFAFGRGRQGSSSELVALGDRLGFGVSVVGPVGEGAVTFSSTSIREHLRRGELRQAAEQLGYWWRVRGTVEKGAGRGKGLGFPTVNLALAPGQDIAHGIYAVRVDVASKHYHGAGYVGPRPTFGESTPVLEVYLFDFVGELYGEEIEVEFIARLRGDLAFDTPQMLTDQMREDCEQAKTVLAAIEADDPMQRFPLGRALAAG